MDCNHSFPVPQVNSSEQGHILNTPPTKEAAASPVMCPLDVSHLCIDFDTELFHNWQRWTARLRIAAIRRWIMRALQNFRPIDSWADAFEDSWQVAKVGDESVVRCWLSDARGRINMACRTLGYIECILEDDPHVDVDDWSDLYVQSHQLAGQLWGAVIGIQRFLEFVSGWGLVSST